MNTATQQAPQRRITIIPPDPQHTEKDIRKKHLRVAPCCRVSTDSEEQLNSYNAQIAYYTEKIAATPEWTMVRLYADEGITGTSMKKRKEFLKMPRDCGRGKIDLVITKSMSRFGRNRGVLDEPGIPFQQEQMLTAQTFRCYAVDYYEEYRDLSDEAYQANSI